MNLNVKGETINLLEENTRENICDCRISVDFWGHKKHELERKKWINWIIKIKNSLKGTIFKRARHRLEETSTIIHLSDRRILGPEYIKTQFLKWAKDLNKHVIREDL